MRDLPRWIALFGVACLTFAGLSCAGTPPTESATFVVEELADGVWLFRPPDGRTDLTNSLVVERDDGMLVVESQPSVEAGRQLATQIALRFNKPVRFLVVSHAHLEVTGGAEAFGESTLVIGTQGCLDALQDESWDFGGEIRASSADPDEWTAAAPRRPTVAISAPTLLADERNPVRLLPLPWAHTKGDVLVHLEHHDLYYVGALLFPDGNPFGADARLGGWIGALNQLSRLQPKIIVSLRGPAGDAAQVRRNRDSLAWVRGQVEYSFVDAVAPEKIPARVLDLPELAQYFDPRASPSFLPLLVERALEESLESRRKRGYEVE